MHYPGVLHNSVRMLNFVLNIVLNIVCRFIIIISIGQNVVINS